MVKKGRKRIGEQQVPNILTVGNPASKSQQLNLIFDSLLDQDRPQGRRPAPRVQSGMRLDRAEAEGRPLIDAKAM
jgi:hypothetical protein